VSAIARDRTDSYATGTCHRSRLVDAQLA